MAAPEHRLFAPPARFLRSEDFAIVIFDLVRTKIAPPTENAHSARLAKFSAELSANSESVTSADDEPSTSSAPPNRLLADMATLPRNVHVFKMRVDLS
jgi:hypothetical protein